MVAENAMKKKAVDDTILQLLANSKEDILEDTLFEAKVRSLDLDNTVAEALRQVRSA